MEISQIRHALPFMFPTAEKDSHDAALKNVGDTIDVRMPDLIPDDEVDNVLNETIGMIGSDSAAALSVHSGLSESRVFALLGL